MYIINGQHINGREITGAIKEVIVITHGFQLILKGLMILHFLCFLTMGIKNHFCNLSPGRARNAGCVIKMGKHDGKNGSLLVKHQNCDSAVGERNLLQCGRKSEGR